MTSNNSRAVVVGGGIAGLCAAYDLVEAGWQVEVHEAEDRWGGKVWSSPVGDRMVDAGPDTFLARVEPGIQLCRDLGLDHELTSPVAKVPAYIVRDGELHELPAESTLGVPTDLEALRHSRLITGAGIDRAVVDLETEATVVDGDISVGALCRARLGDEITDRLIDPILGGINASDIDRLSLRAGAPLLAAALDEGPSLIDGLVKLRPTAGPALGARERQQPVFFGLPGGTARIIDSLLSSLEGRARLRLNSPVTMIDELVADVDAVVIATPSFVAAGLLQSLSPTAAAELATIEYASVAQVVVEVPLDGVERNLDASGILFPRVDGTMLSACTWLSTKWAHYQRPDTVLLRLSSGRYGDDRPHRCSDSELATTLLGELNEVLGVTGTALATRVQRWPRSFPQYTPGHGARVNRIEEAMKADAPTIRLAGAAYRGIGLPACIADGRQAARSLLETHGP